MGTEKNKETRIATPRRIAFWDLKAIVAIEHASYSTPWNKDQLETMLIEPEVEGWGLYVGGKIQAYAIIRYRTRHAYLETLTVHPKYRRQGMATDLMHEVFDRALQHRSRSLVLEVHETNLAAQLFFGKMGFTVTKVLHKYYEDEADAYLFVRHLHATQTA